MREMMRPKGKQFRGYSVHVTDDQALAAFVAKFGRQPEEIRRTGGGVAVGPLLPEEAR